LFLRKGGEAGRAKLAPLCYDTVMIRTRDFLLFLISVAFLIVVIGVEFIKDTKEVYLNNNHKSFTFSTADTDDPVTFSATVTSVSDTRAEKLIALRQALTEQDLIISKPEPEEPTTTDKIAIKKDEVIMPINSIQLCKNYHPAFIPWTTAKILSEEREGVRVFYSLPMVNAVGTSTQFELETVHAVLPIREIPSNKPLCISGDVIGIAKDGSLIKNNEQKIYSVFGETTIIGYALDGFPIYGLSQNHQTDVCGGIMIDGSYRYYLNKDREGILGCFSGIPATL